MWHFFLQVIVKQMYKFFYLHDFFTIEKQNHISGLLKAKKITIISELNYSNMFITFVIYNG